MKKKTEKLYSANGEPLKIKYKLPNAYICNQGLGKDINNEIVLDTFLITRSNLSFSS